MITKKTLVSIIITLFLSLTAHAQTSVVYGDRSYYNDKQQVTRVFIDKEGSFYPDLYMPDDSIQLYNGSIKTMYQQNIGYFLNHATTVNLNFTTYSEQNFLTYQDSIIQQLSKEIEKKTTKQTDIYTLIHGFRKPKTPMGGSKTAKQDYAYERNLINKSAKDSMNNHFLEIYWDGTYECCFGKNIKKNKSIYKLFEFDSQTNAVHTGYGLRRLFCLLPTAEITLFSHSLGAKVLTSLLFNCYTTETSLTERSYPTPPQIIKAYLVAPAISDAPFDSYYDRTVQNNNYYKISILHNKNDLVLKKRFLLIGPGPTKRGQTSLGCNYNNEADNLSLKMGPTFKSIDLSMTGNSHHVTNYLNQKIMNQLLTQDVINFK